MDVDEFMVSGGDVRAADSGSRRRAMREDDVMLSWLVTVLGVLTVVFAFITGAAYPSPMMVLLGLGATALGGVMLLALYWRR